MTAEQVWSAVSQLLERQDRPADTQTAPVAGSPSQPSASSGLGTDLVGKSVEELVQLLGKNYQTVVVGDRTIYVFPDLGIRVPVVNGKMVAAQ